MTPAAASNCSFARTTIVVGPFVYQQPDPS
jgi:hypothetical protein